MRPDEPAPYACRPDQSRGRLHAEPASPTRTTYQRDRDRVIHSAAFRRLQHKTQVFVYHEGDYYRTRLTHSLEVSQIARSVCRVLGLDEDLAEALALAHDLGHTPFGHSGEDALNEVMEPFGGFDHNAQALRIVTRLEHRYAAYDGLNLAWETLEGLVKHNGPVAGPLCAHEGALPFAIADYAGDQDLELDTYAGAEAQVAALADDIAYNNHDIDDGVRAGLFTPDDLMDVPLVGPVLAAARGDYPDLETHRLIFETVRRLIGRMIEDLLAETRRRADAASPASAEDVRRLGRPLVAFSEGLQADLMELRGFLGHNMYRHSRVKRMSGKAHRVVTDLFARYLNEPNCLPTDWQQLADARASERTARTVADFIAGMTDRFALAEHARLFGGTTELS